MKNVYVMGCGEDVIMASCYKSYVGFYIYIYLYKKVGVLPIRIVKSNVSSVGPSSEKAIGPVFL